MLITILVYIYFITIIHHVLKRTCFLINFQKTNDYTIDKFDLIVLDQDLGKTVNYNTAKAHIIEIDNYKDNRTNPVWINAVKQDLTDDLKVTTIPDDNHYLIVGNDELGERVLYSKSEIKTI